MCTVSYFPTSKGFVLTSTRDEVVKRVTEYPALHQVDGINLFYPKDLKSGGTWIASDGVKKTVCLLNGAWSNHQKKDQYRKSRGKVTLELFEYPSTADFLENMSFHGIEPFTLLIFESKFNLQKVLEVRWDGDQIRKKEKDPQKPYLWSSYTLYPTHIQRKRSQTFENWVKNHRVFTTNEILEFHLQRDFQKDSQESTHPARSVSITQIIKDADSLNLNYLDLLKNQESHLVLKSPLSI